MRANKFTVIFAPLVSLFIIIVLWWAITFFKIVNPLFLPTLSDLLSAFHKILFSSDIYIDILQTLYRALSGLFFSALIAIPLGLVFGRSPFIYRFFELPTEFFRSIPSSALFPLFILLFGIGDASKSGIVFYGCSLILLINTVYGAKPTKEKQDRINMLRSFGATPFQLFKYAILRDALPQIAAGMRVCISLSFVLVIVTEMFLGATGGLGKQIYDYYLQYNIPEMYAVIILLGLVGFWANKLFQILETKIIFWLPNNQ